MKLIIIFGALAIVFAGIAFFIQKNKAVISNDPPVNEGAEKANLLDSKEFTLATQELHEFRIELRDYFTEEEIASRAITIIEKTWDVPYRDGMRRTVWYKKTSTEEKEVHTLIWNFGDEF